MDLSRLLNGGTPFVTNIFVRTASALDYGAIICANALTSTAQGATLVVTVDTAANNSVIGVTQVSSAQASADVSNVNAMNAYRFNIQTDGIPDRGTIAGGDWLPTCINPDALYFGLYSNVVTSGTVTASNAIVNSITATTGTVVTVTSTSEVGIAGGWLMDGAGVSSVAGTPTYTGQLRYVSNVTAVTKFGLLTAMNVSTDSNLLWASTPNYKSSVISTGGNLLRSHSGTTAGKYAQGLLIVDNYVTHDQAPMHSLRSWVDDGLNGLSGHRMYSELLISKFYSVNNE